MCKKLVFLISVCLVLGLAGSGRADPVPSPWANQDIGNPLAGNADYNPDPMDQSIAVTANGNDIWDNDDSFHYVYKEWSGDCELIARVASIVNGTNEWRKAGVMIRETLADTSRHVFMCITAGGGGGSSFQGRDTTGGGSFNTDAGATALGPYWVRLTRVGDSFSGYISENGSTWTQVASATGALTEPFYIGLAVTSHETAQLTTATFDNLGGDIKLPATWPTEPNPVNHEQDVPVETNLTWTRGDYCIQDEVFFGTDPLALLPVGPPIPATSPAEFDPGDPDIVASTTYYWQVVDTDGNGVPHPGAVWDFSTISGKTSGPQPFDGKVVAGILQSGTGNLYQSLVFEPGPTNVTYVGYGSEVYNDVLTRAEDANLGPVPFPPATTYYMGLDYGSLPYKDSLERGKTYYWCVDGIDAKGNKFAGDVWKFIVRDIYAFAPSPPNEAVFIPTDVLLKWLPGYGPTGTGLEHDVYIGTDFDAVKDANWLDLPEPPEYKGFRSEPNYPCSGLEESTTYYWRIDEVWGREPFAPKTTGEYVTGHVWSFTTMPPNVGTIREDLWWGIPGSVPSDLYGDPRFPGNPDETRSLDSFNSGTALGDDYGGMIHGWLHPAYSGDYTFWIATDDGSELYLSSDDGPANRVLIASVAGWVDPYDWYNLTGTDNPNQESAPIWLEAGQKYYIRAVWKEGGGGDHCQVAWQGPDQPLTPVVGDPQGLAYVIPGSRLEPFMQLWAHDPDPQDGQASVPITSKLRWGPGDHAAKHDVYLSTDKALVESRDGSVFKGSIDANEIYVPLSKEEFYYWAIDEVNDLGPDPCEWKGETWMFRAEGAAGGLLGLYYYWDGVLPPPLPDYEPGPVNPFQELVKSRIDPEINWDWGDGSPFPNDPNINVDDFACKWIGHIECPIDANYTFYTETDDGARLFINGTELQLLNAGAAVQDSWRQQGMTWWSGSIVLTAGLHDIEMHMYERAGGAGARLAWSAIPLDPLDDPITRQIIPPLYTWPPLFATGEKPPDLSTIDERRPALEWFPGLYARAVNGHELYFSASFDDVNDRNPAIKKTLDDPYYPYPVTASPLQLGKTYYWCVDEVKSPTERWDARRVWRFTISECISLDNMEAYIDRVEMRGVWTDGYSSVGWGSAPYYPPLNIASSGSNLHASSEVGSPYGGTGPIHGGDQAMAFYYENDGNTTPPIPGEEHRVYRAPNFSEIEANTVENLGVGEDWTAEGVKALTLWYQGHPLSDGSFGWVLEDPSAETWRYILNGRGRDIQGRHDEFYFAGYYPLVHTTGGWDIRSRVTMDNTDPWAKAGLMMRQKMTPQSAYAAVFVTPGHGVIFQWREIENGPTYSVNDPTVGLSVPIQLKLERQGDRNFRAWYWRNSVWEDVKDPNGESHPPQDIPDMNDTVHVGLAVTSHNADLLCSADFNDLHAYLGGSTEVQFPPWSFIGDVGLNDAEQMYVALSDGSNPVSVVNNPDANAAIQTSWQEWNILLTDFTNLDLSSVKKVYVGFGDRDYHPAAGGKGIVYIDDIRACPPRCVPEFGKPLADIAQPYDCTVDEKDMAVLLGDWLLSDELGTGLVARYEFEGNLNDISGNEHHGTAVGAIAYDSNYPLMGQVLSLPGGANQFVEIGEVGISGNAPTTIACWAKADHNNIPDWTLVFGFTGTDANEGGNGSHFNIGSIGGPGGVGTHTWGWEETIFSDEEALEWHHYAMTYDGTTVQYFGDGVPMDTEPDKSNVQDLSIRADRVHIGSRVTQDSSFPGKVDDARIYKRVLSDAEIVTIMGGGEADVVHMPITSVADLYQGEPQGQQWINFRDYSVIAGSWLEKVLWP